MPTMKRTAKHDGVGNIVLEEVEVPTPGDGEVLVRLEASLISRGSEIGGRYLKDTAVDPASMGYSDAGVIAEVGAGVTELSVGDRVGVVAPHAEYVIGQARADGPRQSVVPLPDDLGFEAATFLPLATSSLAWADSAMISPDDSVAILGQGLVGSIILQVLRQRATGTVVAVDGLPKRCALAQQLGADAVVDCSQADPVEAVRELCPGGVRVVIDCVGGSAGVQSFAQAQEMCAGGGTILLVGLYHGAPLPLDASKVMGKLVVGGIRSEKPRSEYSRDAVRFLQAGHLATEAMISHRFRLEQAKEAFDLLVDDLGATMGVLFVYQ